MTSSAVFSILLTAALSGPTIPEALRLEHEQLHRELAASTKLGGETGKAATHVAKLLHAHFVKEEELALPPLGLLAELSAGHPVQGAREIVALTERFQKELPGMLDEHKAIVAALDELNKAATAERHAFVVRYVEKLKLHAASEEQVLYPAAVLVGRYLKATGTR